MRIALLVLAGLTVTIAANSIVVASTSTQEFDWRADWAVQRGFDISIDSEGFELPTSIAFVPNPGTAPQDPLYYVTELFGKVKVVTNDRRVHIFAEDFFHLESGAQLTQQVGLAGICLDPVRGYVFVTFAYSDSEDILRNNIVRFQSTPGTFSRAPASQVEFTEVFASYRSSNEHQIGNCRVKNDLLYVGVGDGNQTKRSQQLDSLLGKMLRMTLDGKPVSQNPFYRDDDIGKAANYVWASGLRNPFGLAVVDDRVFIADNGPAIDRFLEVQEGSNQLWDGSDASIGTNAVAVFFPGKGVAQLDRYPDDSDLFPARFRNSFFLTVTGSPSQKLEGIPAVNVVPFDLEESRLQGTPKALIRYRGGQIQVVAGLAFGPDGLYFTPMLPNMDGFTGVLKVSYDPASDYPFLLEDELNPVVLMNTYGCAACHTLSNSAESSVGPSLERDALVQRLQQRLTSEEYISAVQRVDKLNDEPFVSFRPARRDLQQAQGLAKINLWLKNRIQEPRFDDPNAQMPNLGLSEKQAGSIAAFLSGYAEETAEAGPSPGFFKRISNSVRGWFPKTTRANAKRYGLALFGVGLGVGGVAALSAFWGLSKLRDRRRRNQH